MKFLIAGKGGQGVQTIAQILAQAAVAEDKQATYIPNFGVEQRGGFSLAFVIIDDHPIAYPKFQTANLLAILTDEVLPRIQTYQGPTTKLIKGEDNLSLLRGIINQTKIISMAKVEALIEQKLAGKIKKG